VTLLYNAVMLAVDAGVIVGLWRYRHWLHRVCFLTLAAEVMVALAALLGPVGQDAAWDEGFGRLRLLTQGLFGHGVGVLLFTAILLIRTHRAAAITHGLAALVLAAVAVDAFFIEPTWLEVTHVRIRSAKLDRPVKIVVVADFQTDRIGPYERRVLRAAAAQGADLILFAGDYIEMTDAARRRELYAEFREAYREANPQAPLGVFAVKGNIDRSDWAAMFDGLPVHLFDETDHVDLPGLRLTGLSQKASLHKRYRVSGTDRFHVVLGHHPDFALSDRVDADLLLAGHTHGGQVCLPLIGPVIPRTRVPRSWAAGLTVLPDGRRLIVSRGTGMKRKQAPRVRFLCRPELVVIEVLPE
jgi:predicted MPP superfamily phosphohydrolase